MTKEERQKLKDRFNELTPERWRWLEGLDITLSELLPYLYIEIPKLLDYVDELEEKVTKYKPYYDSYYK